MSAHLSISWANFSPNKFCGRHEGNLQVAVEAKVTNRRLDSDACVQCNLQKNEQAFTM